MLALLLLVLVGGCAAPARVSAGEGPPRAALARWAGALLAHDEAGYLALDRRPGARAAYANTAAVPLASWEYAVLSVRREGRVAFVAAELRYRIAGYDTEPVVSAREVELGESDGHWYVTGDRPGAGAHPQLWDQGKVTAVRGTASLVLGVGQDPATLQGVAATADRAVPAVAAVWPRSWDRRVLMLVPASLEAMAGLLGSPAASYAGIAAVTTTPGDRVTVNPDAYRKLDDLGRRVVLTHETVHVATRAATTGQTPLWLSEGFADYVAYRSVDRTPRQAAPALARAVRSGDGPSTLPSAEDFAFSGDPERLARAYESSWLAVRLAAERWGVPALISFYEAAAVSPASAFAVVLGTTEPAFTADWRAYLRAQLS